MPEAKARENQLLGEIHAEVEQQNTPSFEMFANDWLKTAHFTRKISTIDNYKAHLRQNLGYTFRDKKIAEVTTHDVFEAVYNPKLELKPASRARFLECLRVVFRDALRARLIPCNPCDGIKVKIPETELLAWNVNEVNHFLSEARRQNHSWRPIWTVTIFSGLRSGEAYALTWNRVDLHNRRLYVVSNWTSKDGYHETKGKKNRVVPINDELHEFLTQLQQERGHEKFVLPHFDLWTRGEQAKVLREFARSIGLKEIRFHDLRASFITICLLQNVAPVKVQHMVGHESLETTMRYVRLVGADLDGATSELGITSNSGTGCPQKSLVLI